MIVGVSLRKNKVVALFLIGFILTGTGVEFIDFLTTRDGGGIFPYGNERTIHFDPLVYVIGYTIIIIGILLLAGTIYLYLRKEFSQRWECSRCGKEIRKNLASCPKCGCSYKKRRKQW